DQSTFSNLLSIVSMFPTYFVGSNADLPIVGGSMLTHEHYQGGRHTFPMAKAPIETQVEISGHPHVFAGIVKWPMSVIRLVSADSDELINAAEHVRQVWNQ
ncbi:UDP-glucose--hexose-1-phosphate uridylyltransferase, partial [Lacticaseibacillus paracasei]